MKIKNTLKVRLTLMEEALGTASNNPDLHGTYIASRAPDAATMEEEIEALGIEGVVDRAMTVFPKLNGQPFVYDYQIKGFFKDAAKAMRKIPGTVSSKVKAYKQEIDGLVFVQPRCIVYDMHGGEMGECQRPLRASTPQGERVSIAHSETVPAGSTLEFEVLCMTDQMEDLVRELLEYGQLRGLSQWRNSGKGRFVHEILK